MFLDQMINNLNISIKRYPESIKYLESRRVTFSDIEKYKIGFSRIVVIPEDKSDERKRFMDEMWKGKKIQESIVFPITNILGQVEGIIARKPKDKIFKTFITNHIKFCGFFFGLYQALESIYATKRVFVVEGPFDCIAFSKVYPNTVSSLTSGLYKNQYEFLSFICDDIITVFDSDEAGREGVKLAKFWAQKGRAKIYDIDIGYKDPAQCLESLSFPAFKSYVEKKVKDQFLFGGF